MARHCASQTGRSLPRAIVVSGGGAKPHEGSGTCG